MRLRQRCEGSAKTSLQTQAKAWGKSLCSCSEVLRYAYKLCTNEIPVASPVSEAALLQQRAISRPGTSSSPCPLPAACSACWAHSPSCRSSSSSATCPVTSCQMHAANGCYSARCTRPHGPLLQSIPNMPCLLLMARCC